MMAGPVRSILQELDNICYLKEEHWKALKAFLYSCLAFGLFCYTWDYIYGYALDR